MRVYFRLGNATEIAATSIYFNSLDPSKRQMENVIVFNKPIFATSIIIAMNDPLKGDQFAIAKVQFFTKSSYIIVKNALSDKCKYMCFFVNTDKPRPGVPVEAYNCSEAIVTGNGNEMFIYTARRALLHLNSKLCVSYNQRQDIVLQKCNQTNPEYKIQFKTDLNMYFEGSERDCIYIDDSTTLSPNYVSPKTMIFATSQADDMTYRKENVQGKIYFNL
jgi:hypothetical protein